MTLPQYQRQGYGRLLIDFSKLALSYFTNCSVVLVYVTYNVACVYSHLYL